MPQSRIHVDIVKQNISAAQQRPMYGNWAACGVRQYAHLDMPSPFSSSGIVALNSLLVRGNMEGQHRKVWDGLHVSPRLAPSKGASCARTLHVCSARANRVLSCILTSPCLFPGCDCLCNSEWAPIPCMLNKAGLQRPVVPRHCAGARCEIHMRLTMSGITSLTCPHLAHIRWQFRSLFQVADGVMQSFVWHQNLKAVCYCLAAILALADDSSMGMSS